MPNEQQVETNIPQRLDRLPWSRWHTTMVVALGITWLLDGLEVTLAGSLASVLKDKKALGLSTSKSAQLRPVIWRARSSARYFSAGSPTASGARSYF
jgi:hypothetical protein